MGVDRSTLNRPNTALAVTFDDQLPAADGQAGVGVGHGDLAVLKTSDISTKPGGPPASGPTAGRCATCALSTASGRSSSSRTAPGRTARSNASTAPWPPSGPTDRSSPRTTNEPLPLPRGWSTTTLDDATNPSQACPRSAGCNQRPARVRLGLVPANGEFVAAPTAVVAVILGLVRLRRSESGRAARVLRRSRVRCSGTGGHGHARGPHRDVCVRPDQRAAVDRLPGPSVAPEPAARPCLVGRLVVPVRGQLC